MTIAALILLQQDDLLLVIWGFLDFPTLLRIQRVCSYWNQRISSRVVPGLLGHQKFQTRDELCEKIQHYCSSNYKVRYADALARTYGWPIGKWNVSQLTSFESVFNYRSTFNEDLSEWDVSNATNLSYMFHRASSFDQDLSQWNTSKVTNMASMFLHAKSFRGDGISTWDTSKVTNMAGMFLHATSFNGDISQWDTSNVVAMDQMFRNATSFHQDLSQWNVAQVRPSTFRLFWMFHGATAFDEEHHAPNFSF